MVFDPKLFTTQPRHLTTLRRNLFENIVGKGENAGNQHFLLFPQCFLPIQKKRISVFKLHLFCPSANAFNLDQGKNLLFGKRLKSVNPVFYSFISLVRQNAALYGNGLSLRIDFI